MFVNNYHYDLFGSECQLPSILVHSSCPKDALYIFDTDVGTLVFHTNIIV